MIVLVGETVLTPGCGTIAITRRCGAGGAGVDDGVGVGVADGVAVGVDDADGVGVDVGVDDTVGVGIGVAVSLDGGDVLGDEVELGDVTSAVSVAVVGRAACESRANAFAKAVPAKITDTSARLATVVHSSIRRPLLRRAAAFSRPPFLLSVLLAPRFFIPYVPLLPPIDRVLRHRVASEDHWRSASRFSSPG
ncbi:MAG: hypothetical protein ACLQUT_01935 [Thermoleophilia bacterium]